jgi:hypothetical protein
MRAVLAVAGVGLAACARLAEVALGTLDALGLLTRILILTGVAIDALGLVRGRLVLPKVTSDALVLATVVLVLTHFAGRARL